MKWGVAWAIAPLLLCGAASAAPPSRLSLRPGDTYEITMIRDSSQSTGELSSGSSHDQDTMVERVISLRADGVELEYDLSPKATKQDRAAQWQFPARVLRPPSGTIQLINRAELETRIEAWLKAAKWPRTVCGHWIFTWNAFRIECDPESVIETIEAFDIAVPDLPGGSIYRDKMARRPAVLVAKASGSGEMTFTAKLEIDPDAVRRERAQADVVTGEILRKPKTFESALSDHGKEAISGTISATLESDSTGNVWRRIKVTNIETRKPDGQLESQATTETIERHLTSRRPP